MEKVTLGIIGCGNMGRSIAEGVNAGMSSSFSSILLYDKEIERSSDLANSAGQVSPELETLVSNSDILIIAVKPQDSEDLFAKISSHIDKQTIVSIMAGVKIKEIQDKIGKKNGIIRVMPNMGALVKESMTCISTIDGEECSDVVKNIFSTIGQVIEMKEDKMDHITAISGSGPAYLFYLADAMIAAAEEMDMEETIARKLVLETLYGAIMTLKASESDPGELIKKVASKGGTTEAALSVFDKNNMKDILMEAIKRAKERSEELSGG